MRSFRVTESLLLVLVTHLRRLRHRLVQSRGATLHLLLDVEVAPLGVGVALRDGGPLLEAELGQLGSDLQQLVDVGLVLGDGLPQQLQRRTGNGENTWRRLGLWIRTRRGV